MTLTSSSLAGPRCSSMAVDWVYPANLFWFFDRLDLEVDDDRLVVAAHQHAFEGFIARGVDLLVRHIGRHEDEVARPSLGDVFEGVAPAHPRPALQHVNDAFERAVVVRPGLGVGMDVHGAGPDLLCAHSGEIDRRSAVHPGGLRRVGVELVARADLDTALLPIDVAGVVMLAHRVPLPCFVLIWALLAGIQEIVTPLSTGSTCPVTSRDSSLAR